MKLKYIHTVIALTAAMTFAACSDNDDTNFKGQPVPADNPGIYFPLADTYYYEFQGDDSKLVPVTIARAKTDSELTVPLEIESADVTIGIPAEITFAQGQSQVTFYADCSEIPAKQVLPFKISIPDDYTNPYVAGCESFECRVLLLGVWETIAADVKYIYEDQNQNTLYQSTTGELQTLEGTGRYKLTNFLGSGLDINFSLGQKVGKYNDFVPLSNFIDYEDYYGVPSDYGCWYFYDSTNQAWPAWSPDGSSTMIEYALFYGYEKDENYLWSYIGLDYGKAYFVIEASMSDGNYTYIYVTAKFTPVANQ